MKFLFATGIYPPEIGGPAGYVKGLANAFVERGHDIAIITYGDDKTERSEKFKVESVKRGYSPLIRYVNYAFQVWKNGRKADLIYAMGPVSEGFPAMIANLLLRKFFVLKIVGDYAWEQYQQKVTSYTFDKAQALRKLQVTSEGLRINKDLELLDEFVEHRHGGKIRVFEWVERWVARRADKVIVPSSYLKSIVEKWGIESDKIKVVYNSIAPLLRTTYDVQRTTPRKIILTAVRAVPWKGGDFLCDVMKELPEEYKLVVAGDGPELDRWKKHAEAIGVDKRVSWLGRISRDELANWYTKADLFVLATGYEGFPHVVVEAASMGVPCIVSDKGGNPEIAGMFPGLVKVAKYRDLEEWKRTISSNCELRTTNLEWPKALEFDYMVGETERALEEVYEKN